MTLQRLRVWEHTKCDDIYRCSEDVIVGLGYFILWVLSCSVAGHSQQHADIFRNFLICCERQENEL